MSAFSSRALAGRALHRLVAGAALCLALAPVAPATAADAAAPLRAFAADVKSASGSFTQSTQNSQGQPAGTQSGTFAFERPGRFRWAVEQPYEQLIVSDGRELYQYDPDLAQVSVRPVSAAIGNAPAQVLFGEGSIDESFRIEPQPARENLTWLRATPRSPEAGFAHMDIGFDGNLPQRIDILDAFGQLTRVEFTTIVPNPSLPANQFSFTPPQGVDVVRMQ